jgi:hypothetical protein
MSHHPADETAAFADFLRREYSPPGVDATAFDRALGERRLRARRRRRTGFTVGAGCAALLLLVSVPRWLPDGPASLPAARDPLTASGTLDSVRLAAAGAPGGNAAFGELGAAAPAVDPYATFLLGLDALDEPAELVSYLDNDILTLDAAVFGTL